MARSSSSRSTCFFLRGNRCVSVFTAGCRGADLRLGLEGLSGVGVNMVQRWGARRQRGGQWGLLLLWPHVHSSLLQA